MNSKRRSLGCNRVNKKTENILFLTLLLSLCAFGAVILYSSSYVLAGSNRDLGFDKAFYLKKQVGGMLAGFVIFFLIQKVDYYWMKKIVPVLVLISIAGLTLVLFPNLGVNVKGAKRWLRAGPITIQPSEFSRFALIAYFAYLAEKRGDIFGKKLRDYIPPVAVWGIVVLLLLFEPDYGMASVMGFLLLMLLFYSGMNMISLAALLGVFSAGFVGMIFASPYRMKRLFAFLDPQAHAHTSGYQVIQSLIGFANGGFFGTGIGAGKQKLFYLPEIHTDFIFSVIGEETGFLGVLLIATLYLALFILLLRIGRRSSDQFGKYFALGTGISLVLCAFLNMGVCLKLLPPKGMVLPFISFGRSSMIAHLGAMGAVYKISSMGREKPVDESVDRWGWDRGARVPRVIDC